MRPYFFLILFALSLVLITSIGNSYADVISPKKQASLNFSPDDIVCKEELIKLIKTSSGDAACVSPSSANKLSVYGWTGIISAELQNEIMTKKAIPAGTIKHIQTLNQIGASGKLDTTPRIKSYNYVFEVCAGEKNVRAPEIVVTSDSEVKSIKLASMLKSGQCRTTSAIVKANDPQSISSVLLNKGGISKTISDMESQLSETLSALNENKKLLASTTDSKQISEITQKITELKKEINSQRYDLQKYNLFLFSDPKSPAKLPALTSFTGKPVSGLSTDLVSVTKQVSQPMESERIINYNVLLEACTDANLVRIPFVTVSSDYESKEIKIAEKISPNSCQMTATKIFAKDKKSIAVSISSKQSVSSKISEIESSLNELQAKLDLANKNLTNLLSSSLQEPELSKEVTKTTTEISTIRSNIIKQKADVASLLLQVYS